MKNITSKLHRAAGSIGFIKKAIHHEATAKFAQVKGNFINVNDRYKSEKCILLSHLNDHVLSNKLLIKKHYLMNKLKQECRTHNSSMTIYFNTTTKKPRMDSFKTKNYKLKRPIQTKTPMSNYKVSIITLSDYKLSEIEGKQLQLGLEYSFVNKNRNLKKNLAANLE